jgi:hypothetical protein
MGEWAMAKKLQNFSPLVIFFIYSAAAFVVICGYQFFLASQPIITHVLGRFKMSWRFAQAVIAFIELFPALAFSGMVIPFGLKEHSAGGYAGNTFVGKKGFSSDFLKYLFWPVVTACLSAICYSVLFFIVMPMMTNMSTSIEDQSDLYTKSKNTAVKKIESREWAEASQFLDICESIWPDNQEIADLKRRSIDSLSDYRQQLAISRERPVETEAMPVWTGIPGDPLDAADALKLAEEAFDAERYYDSHWLSTLAERLAREGAVEASAARTLASRAWEKIQELEPTA